MQTNATKKLTTAWNGFLRAVAMHTKVILIVLVALTVALPFLTDNRYILRIATLCLTNIMLTLGLNLVTGYMGQMSFGQAAFWGIGSYAGTLAIMKLGVSTIPAMIIAVVISGAFGYLVALPSLKLKGYYLTIVTMGFCEIIRLIELNWTSFTGGALGIMNIPALSLFGLELKSARATYFVAFVLMVLITIIVKNLVNSSFGLSIKAIRDDDDVAETMGINIVRVKRKTFVISAMIAGLAGAFYAQYATFIHPSIYTTTASQELIVMIIFGGLGSLPGTYLGAIVLTLLPELMRDLLQYRMMIYGILMVVMMILKPDGLLGSLDLGLLRKMELEKRGIAVDGQKRFGRKGGEKGMNGNLVVSDLVQKFGGLTALDHVNLEVNFGEIVGVIGPNGAGKTTLFNVITGVYKATSGTVILNGKKINNMKPHQITQLGFARTFQNIRLFGKMTVQENVMMGMCCRSKTNLLDIILCTGKKKKELKAQEDRALEILEVVGLVDKRYQLPGSLPYGAQRKLEIARAMATNPSILLLDEPAAGMNEQETGELLQMVKTLRGMGYTIILIEHDMKFVMNICDRLYVLNHGELIATGTPEEIQKNEDVIVAYLGKEEEEE